jgi:hypothetical protein
MGIRNAKQVPGKIKGRLAQLVQSIPAKPGGPAVKKIVKWESGMQNRFPEK